MKIYHCKTYIDTLLPGINLIYYAMVISNDSAIRNFDN